MMMATKKETGSGANRVILALFLISLFSAVCSDSNVEYDPLNTKYLESELHEEINEAIREKQYFYIGVAGARGTPIQSLCYRQGDYTTQPYASSCSKPSTHHADVRAAKTYKVQLTEVYYADRVDSKAVVCGIEKRLIAKYRAETSFCTNEKSGQDNCIQEPEGIVYLRIYE